MIFDGKCGFCTRTAGWLRRLDRRDRIEFVPYQRPGVLEPAGLSVEQAATEVWWIGSEGARCGGAAAVNAALSAALGVRLPSWLYAVTRPVQDRVYAWVAANRHRLPGVTPHCQANPDDC